ncbi:MAG TPA: polymer-forming cytoskeletal protein [Armatimonadota bacterium]|nr:polymer-forming cytoskeletal protein [Armatimonadota bacterium]
MKSGSRTRAASWAGGLALGFITLTCLMPAIAATTPSNPSPDASAPPGAATGNPDGSRVWHTGHFDIRYTPESGAVVGEYVLWLENARNEVNQLLNYIPTRSIPVRIFANPAAFQAAIGASSDGTSEKGDAYAGVVKNGAIDLAPDPDHPENTAAALTRLYTRDALDQMIAGHAAPWLVEGVEDYIAGGFTPSLPALAAANKANKLIPLGPGVVPANRTAAMDPALITTEPAILKAEAMFAVYYLRQTGGVGALAKLALDVGKGESWADTIHDVSGLTPDKFESAWMGLIQSGVRSVVPPGEPVGTWSTPKSLALGAPKPPAPGTPARIRIGVGDTNVGLADQVDALLVAGGTATIQGTVTSHIGVLGGNLHILSTARVAGHISVLGGSLIVDPGAIVDATAEVSSAYWDPKNIKSDRANLTVTIDRPINVELYLPDRSVILREGNVTVPAKQEVDGVIALGGSLTDEGSIKTRGVAVGGDLRLAALPPKGWQGASAGGSVLVKDKPVATPIPFVTQLPHFSADYTAPAQPGADPVPIFLGVGDSAIPPGQTYDAILCIGGECLVSGVVHGGLLAGGDVGALDGSLMDGSFWVYGGQVRVQEGANVKQVTLRGDQGDTGDTGE